MKFSCTREALLDALEKASRAASKSQYSPVLRAVHLVAGGEVWAEATDTAVYVRARVEKVSIQEAGAVLVDAAGLRARVKALAKAAAVRLHVDEEGNLRVESGRAAFKLASLDPKDWPVWPGMEEKAAIEDVPSQLLHDALAWALQAASSKADASLRGVCFEAREDATRVVATDGYRLHWSEIPRGASMPVTVFLVDEVGAVLPLLKGSLPMRVAFAAEPAGNPAAAFTHPDLQIFVRGSHHKFPDYRQSIPTKWGGCMNGYVQEVRGVERDDLREATRILASGSADYAEFHYAEGALRMVAVCADGEATYTIPAQEEGQVPGEEGLEEEGEEAGGDFRVLRIKLRDMEAIAKEAPASRVGIDSAVKRNLPRPVIFSSGGRVLVTMPVRG